MSSVPDTPSDKASRRAKQSAGGKVGAAITHAKYRGDYITEAARAAFLGQFASDAERSAYFRELGKYGRRGKPTDLAGVEA